MSRPFNFTMSPMPSRGHGRGRGSIRPAAPGARNIPQGQSQNQGQGQSPGQSPGRGRGRGLTRLMKFWRRQVEEWYPQLQQRAYFVPPVFMNRTGERVVKIYGTEVLVKQRPVDDVPQGAGPVLFNSDVREDRSQQNVLKCLRKVSEAGQEVMFVLSQLNFKDYLPCYSAAAASKLPTPKDLKADNKDQGDFDVLVLHRHLGILVGEIKALGDNFQELGLSQQQQEQEVVKKVKSALKQLDKADDVLSHLTQDLQPSPRIVKSLMLPNIPAALLRQALDSNPPLKQAVCLCLDLPPTADPTPHCMTSDDLDSPETWWQQRMKANGDDPAMKDKSVYLDLVSRFCGPATMVSVFCSSDPRLGHQPDVRTEGEGVSETGHRFTRFMVTPSQLTVLHVSPPWAFLVGPPGTGKTFVLILKALDWIRKGEPVLVFSTSESSEGASRMIYHQLEQTLVDQAELSRLHFEHLDLWNTEQDVPKTVASILQKARQGILNIIADEAFSSNDATAFRNLCTELHREAPQLKVWAAALYHQHRPDMMSEVKLTEPLRSPPGVTDLVQESLVKNAFHPVHSYTAGASPLPTVGPPLQEFVHDGPGHEEEDPADCMTCGERVARALKEVLHVGGADRSTKTPQALAYRDVFVLSSFRLLDEKTATLRGFLRGLQAILGPHLGLVAHGSVSCPTVPTISVSDLASFTGPDVVVAASTGHVAGLERKVVVFVGSMRISATTFQHGASRCTAQLLYVKTPEPF